MEHTIGKTIAELRKKQGWTQAQLAERLHVTDKAVSKWESEAGTPEISILPVLANIFGVSLDYLMTGKQPEAQIITMSKIELCAKNDDVEMLKNISLSQKDESNKSLWDYIVKYESIKVFSVLYDKGAFENIMFNVKDIKGHYLLEDYLYMLIISNNIKSLKSIRCTNGNLILKNGIKSLTSVNEKSSRTHNDILTDKVFKTLICDKRVSNDTFDYIISPNAQNNDIWYMGFPYLIHQSYINGVFDKLDLLLGLAEKNNNYAFSNNYVPYEQYYVLKKANEHPTNPHYFGIVRILDKTLMAALNNNDVKYILRMNNINNALPKSSWIPCERLSEHTLKMCRLRADKSVSEEKLREESCVYGKIIDVKEVLATDDYKFIEFMFDKYPFTEWEIFVDYCNKKEWRKLFEMLVDNNIPYEWLLDYLEKSPEKNVFESITGVSEKDAFDDRNKNYLPQRNSGRPLGEYLKKLPEEIKAKKSKLLAEVKLQQEYHKTTDDITKEYLLAQLQNGAIETTIIKLCVKLEGILKAKYHLEGDFYTMLSEWHNKYGYGDDGWGYKTETQDGKLLQKLRMHRNSLVHPDESKEVLTIDEIKKCIDIVCNMA